MLFSDKSVKVLDLETNRVIVVLQHQSYISFAEFSPDGTKVVTADSKVVKVWDIETGKAIASFEHRDYVQSAAFSHDGTRIVTASLDNTAKIWDISRESRSPKDLDKMVQSLPVRLEKGALLPR